MSCYGDSMNDTPRQNEQDAVSEQASGPTSTYLQPQTRARLLSLAGLELRSPSAEIDVLIREYLANHSDLARQLDP